MTKQAGFIVQKQNVKIENNIVKGEEVPLETSYTHLGKYVLDSISVSPDAVAQIDAATGKIDTFGDVKDRSIRCAVWLRKEGVRPNDVLAICTDNHLDTCIPVFAALYLGAPYLPIDDASDIRNLKYFLSMGTPKVIFVKEESANVLLEAIKELESDAKVVVFGKYPGVQSFSDILAEASEQEVANFKCDEIPDMKHIAIIVPTSGTTGMPKGVALSHEYFIRIIQTINTSNVTERPAVIFSKLIWATASIIILFTAVTRWPRISCRTFSAELLFDIINKYKPSYLVMSVSMMQRTIRSENINKCDFSSLKDIVVTGSHVSSESVTVLRELAKNAIVSQVYGATEVGIVTAQQSYDKPESVGLPADNVKIKIVDIQSGEILGPNQKGEICVNTLTRLVEYYKNPEATKAAIDDEGFLHIGDIGYYEDDGNFFLIDRLKELIKFRGFHVSAAEIETILQSHPAVQEAAVIGKPHEIDEEHPLAFVTKVPGREVIEQELIDLVAKEVMDTKRLRGGVIFLESMPRTATDKINKPRLREMLKGTAECPPQEKLHRTQVEVPLPFPTFAINPFESDCTPCVQ